MGCLDPPLTSVPEEYHCKDCAICRGCGSREGPWEFGLKDHNGEQVSTYLATYCKKCYQDFSAGKYCGLCYSILGKENIFACFKCERKAHVSCQVSTSGPVSNQTVCTLCDDTKLLNCLNLRKEQDDTFEFKVVRKGDDPRMIVPSLVNISWGVVSFLCILEFPYSIGNSVYNTSKEHLIDKLSHLNDISSYRLHTIFTNAIYRLQQTTRLPSI